MIAPVEREHRPPACRRLNQLKGSLNRVSARWAAKLHFSPRRKRRRQRGEQFIDELLFDWRREIQRMQRQPCIKHTANGFDYDGMVMPQG
ncbi:hypothetical protein D3C84_1185850 [compost metagenome]